MNVYIVRHGQVPHNVLGQYNSNDEDLTILGVQQAENLREQIDSIKFDVIICSPLKRAKHTADIINVNNQKIIYDETTREELKKIKPQSKKIKILLIPYRVKSVLLAMIMGKGLAFCKRKFPQLFNSLKNKR